MTLNEAKTKIAECPNDVIQKSFVLSLLGSIESDYYIKDDEIPAHDSKAAITINERMIREVI